MAHSSQHEIPAYKKIQHEILKRIETGRLRPGDPVSSERELARLYDVSLMTARHASVGLEEQGVLRRNRHGTFVASPQTHLNKLIDFTELMANRGLKASTRVLSFSVVDDPEIAAKLALPGDSPLIKIVRLLRGGKKPFGVETCHLSAAKFSYLTEAVVGHWSLFSILEEKEGLTLVYADEEVDATPADTMIARLLAISVGAPVLRIDQIICSKQNQPILHTLGLYRPDRQSLFIRRFR